MNPLPRLQARANRAIEAGTISDEERGVAAKSLKEIRDALGDANTVASFAEGFAEA